MAPFDIAELREITAYDDLELDTLGDEKTALFLIMSDTDSTSYGSKIVTMEKHTKDRDLIIRLCLAGHFNWDETNRALKLYWRQGK